MSRRPGKKKRVHIGRIILLLFVAAAAAAAGWGWYSLQPAGTGKTEDFTVNEGESLTSILTRLQDDGMIRNADFSRLWLQIKGVPGWYAGTYPVSSDMPAEEIMTVLSDPSNAVTTDVRVTIPEGWWAKEIAQALSEKFPYTKEEFLQAWNDMDYIRTLAKDYPFLNVESLEADDLKVKLEGYLFPETYMIDQEADVNEITRTFLDQFEKVYDSLKSQFDKSDMNVEEVVTLASIVQFESGSPADMKEIAGVFENRLTQDMPLESSVTVCYALYDKFDDPKACETNVDIDSPYNTYLVKGLPPGPILNPGREALEAVLDPADNDYLFFVADIYNKKSDPGKVYYAKTYEEHLKLMEELGLVIE